MSDTKQKENGKRFFFFLSSRKQGHKVYFMASILLNLKVMILRKQKYHKCQNIDRRTYVTGGIAPELYTLFGMEL